MTPAVVRRMAVTFVKRDWGGGRETWREAEFGGRRMCGRERYVLRRISNRQAKRRERSGELRCY